MKFLIIFSLVLKVTLLKGQSLFPLTIIHLNDIHARFEEVNWKANICKDPNECIGGYARVVHMIKVLKETMPNSIYLNAADNFQGTLWYNHFKWNATQHFLNMLPADAMTLGNHEFDDGIEGLVPFMERVAPLTPIVSCNIDATLEPTMQPLFTKSTILNRNGTQIGIVGVTTTSKSNWGRANVLPEVENVRKEVEKLTEEGIKIIVVLSHCGLDTDREIAKFGGPIDIIVGGHSHSFLYSGSNPSGPDTPVADYPTIEEQEGGRKVLIVQASAHSKYLGNITLYFDDNGEIQSHEGAPIFLAHEVPQDGEILQALVPWKLEIDPIQYKPIGWLSYELDSYCYSRECGMGNLATDAMAWSFLDLAENDEWTGAAIAFQIPGGVRSGLFPGNIIYAELVTTTPFANKLVLLELPGSAIREALEFGVSDPSYYKVLQQSGVKVVYDLNREPFKRVVEVKVLCQKCSIPKYEDLNDDKIYKVAMVDFLADGGDGFESFRRDAISRVEGRIDIDVLSDYMQKFAPWTSPPLLGRIRFI